MFNKEEQIKEWLEKLKVDEDDYLNFLRRKDAISVAGLGVVKSSIQGRFLNEQRGGRPMDRCNTFLWMAVDSFSSNPENKKENLEFLIGLLLSWYLEDESS